MMLLVATLLPGFSWLFLSLLLPFSLSFSVTLLGSLLIQVELAFLSTCFDYTFLLGQ